MSIHDLIARMEKSPQNDAVLFNDEIYEYKDLLELIDKWKHLLEEKKIRPGSTIAVVGEYSPDSIALIIALVLNKNIIAPLCPPIPDTHQQSCLDIAYIQYIITLLDQEYKIEKKRADPCQNDMLTHLIDQQRPGLILFTSGSTGQPKGVLHDFNKLLTKYISANKSYRTLCFLMFDHIAGIDTYFYSLYSGGTAVIPTSRNAADICRLIETHKVEVLPTSPTFLNLLLLSEDHKKYDLTSLKIITFGSERISTSLLERLEETFDGVRLIQKYGVTELGSPPSRSKEGDSTWIKMNSDQFKTKVIDDTLYIKANTVMIGYLNADNPFTQDGWFNTGDAVEVDGEYIRILGRKSEIINVGGEKVYPAEVENLIQEINNVAEVTVYGKKNSILGEIVCAKVRLLEKEEPKLFVSRLKRFCFERLEKYKIPVKVDIDDKLQHNIRYKKKRVNLDVQLSE